MVVISTTVVQRTEPVCFEACAFEGARQAIAREGTKAARRAPIGAPPVASCVDEAQHCRAPDGLPLRPSSKASALPGARLVERGGTEMRRIIMVCTVCALFSANAGGQGPKQSPTANGPDQHVQMQGTAGAAGNFDGVSFGGADLGRANFHAASLVGAGLEFVRLDSADFVSADLSYATVLPNSAKDANFTRAVLTHVTGNSGNFDGAILSVSRLEGANFVGASFVGAYLGDTNLFGASFAYANLTNASLVGAKISNTDFFGALWSNTICPDGSNSDTNPNCGF
jgi:hypothetical protein